MKKRRWFNSFAKNLFAELISVHFIPWMLLEDFTQRSYLSDPEGKIYFLE